MLAIDKPVRGSKFESREFAMRMEHVLVTCTGHGARDI